MESKIWEVNGINNQRGDYFFKKTLRVQIQIGSNKRDLFRSIMNQMLISTCKLCLILLVKMNVYLRCRYVID